MVRSSCERPDCGAPAAMRWVKVSGLRAAGCCSCEAGRSMSPNGHGQLPPAACCCPGSPGMMSCSSRLGGSGASHGRCGRGMRSCRAACWISPTRTVRSVISASWRPPVNRPGWLGLAESGPVQRRQPRPCGSRVAGPGSPPADPSGLERHDRGMPEPHVGASRRGLGDGRGVRDADHVGALGRVGDPQRDPQVGVGADVLGDHPGGALGRQDEVDAERPAPLRDVDQAGDEIGQFPAHRRELVDDDDQPRQRLCLPPVRRAAGKPRCPWRRPRPGCARAGSARPTAIPAPARPGAGPGR